MVIKNLENKIKLVLIICSLFLVGCVIISLGSIWTARGMVSDAHQKVYVLDGNVPVLVNRSRPRQPQYDGGNLGRGSEEPCRNVPSLLLHPCT